MILTIEFGIIIFNQYLIWLSQKLTCGGFWNQLGDPVFLTTSKNLVYSFQIEK